MKHIFHMILLALCCAMLLLSCESEGKKYIAYSTDAEAYFMPRDFEHLKQSIEYLNANYEVENATIDRIGELVRRGKIVLIEDLP